MKTKHLMSFAIIGMAVAFLLPHAATAQTDEPPYFKKNELPNPVVFLPAPPDTSSTQFVYDISQYMWGKSLRNTPRGVRAREEAVDQVDDMLVHFSKAFGYSITPKTTPAIYHVMARGIATIHDGTYNAKKQYMRKRPYMRMNEPTIVPEDEEKLRTNGSYPSGHTVMGWGMALLLSEINPDAQDAIFTMGYEWGQSRVIAGFHWQSDVDAARLVASAVYARLHTDDTFLNDMRKAREEWAKIKKEKKK